MRIELNGVTVAAGGRILLAGVDLDLGGGEALVIHGPTGSGVTSLLKTAAGLRPPAAGRVLHDGRDLAALSPAAAQALQRRSGFAFQDAALWANTPLWGNLELPLRARHPELDAAARRERIEQALAALDWSVDLALRPAALSPGERLLLGFLRAVIPGPEVLFLDDVLAPLDPHWRSVLLARLASLRDDGTAVVVGCHDPELVPLPGARRARIAGGRLVPDDGA